MTIVMEEDAFSSSLSSLSTLSPQSNYQTLIGRADSLNASYLSSTNASPSSNQSNSQQQQHQPSGSPDSGDSCPFAVFLFRSNNNSELFEERRIMLDKPCKIGRSVAKIRPEPNNAIFDCKVLSRNHALLWQENGKFYLQDTKSSNGTFLNGNRLGKSNEDSAPFELSSGDIIQFGVDVTENTKKVTHGCITVEIKLYHRNGVEALNKPNQQSNKIDVQTQELYQLALFLQEAMMREEILHQKLNSLQTFIDQAKETSENGWLTLIDEDRLLTRIDYLEKQTILSSKAINEDSFKKNINTLRDEKFNIESSAKLTVQKMIEEKNDLAQKCDDLKTSYAARDEEYNQLKKVYDDTKKNLIELAEKHQDLQTQIEDLTQNLNDIKSKYTEKCNQYDTEKEKYDNQIAELMQNEKNLNIKIESLIAEKDFQEKRIETIISKYEKKQNSVETVNNSNEHKPTNKDLDSNDHLNNHINNDNQHEQTDKELVEENIIKNNMKNFTETDNQYDNNNNDDDDDLVFDEQQQSSTSSGIKKEQESNNSNNHENNNVDNNNENEDDDDDELVEQEQTALKLINQTTVVLNDLSNLNDKLKTYNHDNKSQIDTINDNNNEINDDNHDDAHSLDTNNTEALMHHSSKYYKEEDDKENIILNGKLDLEDETCKKIITNLYNNSNCSDVNNKLTNLTNNVKPAQDFDEIKHRLDSEINNNFKLREEIKLINSQFTSNLNASKNLELELIDKNNKLNTLESELEQKNIIINELIASLNNDNNSKNESSQVVDNIKSNIDKSSGSPVVVVSASQTVPELKDSSSVFNTSSQQVEEKLDKEEEEVVNEEHCDSHNNSYSSVPNSVEPETSSNTYSNEYYFIKDEYSQIISQIINIESAIKNFVSQNKISSQQLEENLHYLEESCKKLNKLKDNLLDKESQMELNLTDAQKEANQNKLKIIQLQEKIKEIEEKCNEYKDKYSNSEEIINEMSIEFDNLSLRAKIVSYVSMIPLFLLVIAIMIAFYPMLAVITATGL